MSHGGQLDWLLDDLVARVTNIDKAVILSRDGLVIGASSGPVARGLGVPVRRGGRLPEPGQGRGPALRRRRGPADRGRDGVGLPVRDGRRRGQLPGGAGRRGGGRAAWSPTRWPCWSGESASTWASAATGAAQPRRVTPVQPPDSEWLDQDAGPVVRPYALTGGRTRPVGERFDLLALVTRGRGVHEDTARSSSRSSSSCCGAADADPARRPGGRPGPAARRRPHPGLRPARTRPGHDSPAGPDPADRSADPQGGRRWPTTTLTRPRMLPARRSRSRS